MDDCIFCRVAAGTAQSWKVYESDFAYAFLDVNPVNEYHTLVIPRRHYADVFDAPAEVLIHVVLALKRVVDLYRDKLGIENVQIVNSSGAEAQQDVFHLHFHVVPRHEGDGQDVKWTPRPEMRERFDELLEGLE